MSDPAKYRSREEVQTMRDNRDPLDMAKREMLELGFADEAWFKACEKEVKAEVAEAADFAEQAPEPDLSELTTDVLVGTY
jgi:pyruvate dehydrogenase E1 component alpha subunit